MRTIVLPDGAPIYCCGPPRDCDPADYGLFPTGCSAGTDTFVSPGQDDGNWLAELQFTVPSGEDLGRRPAQHSDASQSPSGASQGNVGWALVPAHAAENVNAPLTVHVSDGKSMPGTMIAEHAYLEKTFRISVRFSASPEYL